MFFFSSLFCPHVVVIVLFPKNTTCCRDSAITKNFCTGSTSPPCSSISGGVRSTGDHRENVVALFLLMAGIQYMLYTEVHEHFLLSVIDGGFELATIGSLGHTASLKWCMPLWKERFVLVYTDRQAGRQADRHLWELSRSAGFWLFSTFHTFYNLYIYSCRDWSVPSKRHVSHLAGISMVGRKGEIWEHP